MNTSFLATLVRAAGLGGSEPSRQCPRLCAKCMSQTRTNPVYNRCCLLNGHSAKHVCTEHLFPLAG